MKKLVSVAVMLWMGLASLSYAGIPIAQPYQGSGPYWDATIKGSTNPTSGTPAFVVLPTLSKVSGSTTYSGRNCLTRLVLQLSYGSTFYLLDSGTTIYQIEGSGIGTSTTSLATGQAFPGNVGTFNLSWGELGPYCGTAGSSMTLGIPAPAQATPSNIINYEGFTFYPYSANSGN